MRGVLTTMADLAASGTGAATEADQEVWSAGVVAVSAVMILTMLVSAIGRAKQFRSRDD